VKKIIIKSSVLATALFITIGAGERSHAGVFDQLASIADSALATYGREHAVSFRSDLPKRQIDAGIREALVVASDRVIQQLVADADQSTDGATRLSSDMRSCCNTSDRQVDEGCRQTC